MKWAGQSTHGATGLMVKLNLFIFAEKETPKYPKADGFLCWAEPTLRVREGHRFRKHIMISKLCRSGAIEK